MGAASEVEARARRVERAAAFMLSDDVDFAGRWMRKASEKGISGQYAVETSRLEDKRGVESEK